jgi:hypothetical protein
MKAEGGMAGTLNNLAMIHGIKGEFDQALKLYNQSLEITRHLGVVARSCIRLFTIANMTAMTMYLPLLLLNLKITIMINTMKGF